MGLWAACLLAFLLVCLPVFVGCGSPAKVNRKSIAVCLRAACLLVILAVSLSVFAGTSQKQNQSKSMAPYLGLTRREAGMSILVTCPMSRPLR